MKLMKMILAICGSFVLVSAGADWILPDAGADGDDKYKANLERQLETLRSCINTREYNSAAFAEFLAQYQ